MAAGGLPPGYSPVRSRSLEELRLVVVSSQFFFVALGIHWERKKQTYDKMKGWKEDEEKNDLRSGIYLHERIAYGMPYEA